MPSRRPFSARFDEQGFALVGILVLILCVAVIVSSFTFVSQRKSRAEVNFAIGQHLADLAANGHALAQAKCYAAGSTCDAVSPSNPLNGSPADRAITDETFIANGARFNVEIVGFTEAPMAGGAIAFKAPSALMHIQMRAENNSGPPPLSATDKVEILQGALRGGLKRYAISTAGQPGATDPCDGSAGTSFRWGPETTACVKLDATSMGFQFPDAASVMSLGGTDWLVPTWEVALSRTGDKAMYRFPQPNRPDLNVMHAGIEMTNHAVDDIDGSFTQALDAPGIVTTRAGTGPGDPGAVLAVRENKPAHMAQHVQVNQPSTGEPLRVYDQYASGGASMTVNGDVAITGNNLSVGGVMTVPQTPGQPNVTVTDPVFAENVGDPNPANMHDIDLQPQASATAPLEVTVSNFGPLSAINDVNLSGAAPRLAVTSSLTATSLQPPAAGPSHVYGNRMTTASSGQTQINPGAPDPDWHIGTIDQKAGELHLHDTIRTEDCIGSACPDNVTNNPGGGL